MYFTVDFGSLTNDALIHNCILGNVLRRNHIPLGVNPPEFFIKIKLRNDIDQLHICFPVRTKCSNIFPVAIVLIGKKTLAFFLTIRKNMFTKITSVLIFQCDQRILKNRP